MKFTCPRCSAHNETPQDFSGEQYPCCACKQIVPTKLLAGWGFAPVVQDTAKAFVDNYFALVHLFSRLASGIAVIGFGLAFLFSLQTSPSYRTNFEDDIFTILCAIGTLIGAAVWLLLDCHAVLVRDKPNSPA
jgi:hypothetical protein